MLGTILIPCRVPIRGKENFDCCLHGQVLGRIDLANELQDVLILPEADLSTREPPIGLRQIFKNGVTEEEKNLLLLDRPPRRV